MALAPRATVVVNGTVFAGWTSVSVSRSLKQAASPFDLEIVEQAAGPPIPASFRKLMPGDTCEVYLGGHLVVTGFIEVRNPAFGPEDAGVRVSGRSKTADLVDSSIVDPPGEFRDATPAQVIRRVAERHGINVIEKAPPGEPKPRIQVQPGETPFELTDRLTRFRGIAPHDDENGDLVLDRVDLAAAPVASLVEGVNIKHASATLRMDNRHSEITVKGQQPATDENWGHPANQVVARVQDEAVGRYRPLLLFNEEPGDIADLRQRADWEGARRGAESVQLSVTVQGWERPGGGLWKPGDIYFCSSPRIPVHRALLAERVTWAQNDQEGTITEINLTPPETFTPASEADGPSAGGGGTAPASASAAPATMPAGDGTTIELDPIWTTTRPARPAQ